jgi:hypothetical protein
MLKKNFLIQDIETGKYYFQHRIEHGFTAEVRDASLFDSKEDALKELEKDCASPLFYSKFIEIREFFVKYLG